MLSGHFPVVVKEGEEITRIKLCREPIPIAHVAPDVPSHVASLVDQMLHITKGERRTMKQVAATLQAFLAKAPPPKNREFFKEERLHEKATLAEAMPSTLENAAAQHTGILQHKKPAALLLSLLTLCTTAFSSGATKKHRWSLPPKT